LVDESGCYVEDLEALDAAEELGRELGNLNEALMPGTLALDFSAYMPSELDFEVPGPSDVAQATSSGSS
jgi:hypothetical protein